MASLTAHLRSPEDHGRLAFHPECPLCRRERLAGALPAEALVSRRTQALLAAGVLALSSATPTAALAAEPDQEQEGAAAPEQVVATGDPQERSRLRPRRRVDRPAVRRGRGAGAQAAPDPDAVTIALEQEPQRTTTQPVADAGDGRRRAERPTQGRRQRLAPRRRRRRIPTRRRRPQRPRRPTRAGRHATPAPSADRRADPHGARSGAREARDRAMTHTAQRSPAPQRRPAPPAVTLQPRDAHVDDGPSRTGTAERQARPPRRAMAERRSAVTASTSSSEASRCGRSPSDLLGDEASAARIAREVNRLWELNSDRIGTGDRDLLMVGTRLALR